ncbi:hypothetical protein FC19_GL000462 [Liquorilactobacillus aquaticus DSM 21051]|uniref:Uncharacterized protein n=1 Tax=Liquorilactobacillus aquaticus DSM 21051 TaxID=1423725 RepID=A0A0R2CYZ5_9LACO|nr:hypothetical protein [Liquorilactobacillus aquaticus]KRM96935.1 hypothetical protein FC19_GL000462 [Liquorilactobacillus aquaticus DSM 21051]
MEKVKKKLRLAFAILSVFFIPLLLATIWAISTSNKWIILSIFLVDFFYLTVESTLLSILVFETRRKKKEVKKEVNK